MSGVWFDSSAVKMTAAEHYMYLTKFCELLACQSYSNEELKFMLGIHKFKLFLLVASLRLKNEIGHTYIYIHTYIHILIFIYT